MRREGGVTGLPVSCTRSCSSCLACPAYAASRCVHAVRPCVQRQPLQALTMSAPDNVVPPSTPPGLCCAAPRARAT